MRRAVVLSAVLALSACTRKDDGRALFAQAGCASCHAVDGRGGNAGPDLTLVGFRRSREWLERWLDAPHTWKPDTEMPDFRLRPGARRELVAYLSSLRGFEGDAPWSGVAEAHEKGRVLYNKAGCVACHGVKGRGGHPNSNVPGGVIPALDAVVGTYNREELVEKIRNGSNPLKADAAGPAPLVRMPPWKEALSDEEIEAVAAYVATLASPAKGEEW